jgi:hypothetical protein
MKSILIYGALFVLAVVGARSWSFVHHRTLDPVPPPPAPLEAPNVLDCGAVYVNGTATRTVKLRNRGSQALTIRKLVPNCGCIVPAISERILQPLEELEVPLTISAGPNLGGFTKQVVILYEDPTPREQVVQLQATVVRDFTVTPSTVTLVPTGLDGAAIVGEALVTTQRDDLITEGDAPVIGPSTDLIATVTMQKPGHYRVRITGRANPESSRAMAFVKVPTRSREEPVLDIPVLLSQLPHFEIVPERINFGVVPSGETVTRTLVIQYQQASRLGSSRIAYAPKWLDVKLESTARENNSTEDRYTVDYRSVPDLREAAFLQDQLKFIVELENALPITKSVPITCIANPLNP